MFSLIHFFKKKIIMPVISIIISKYLYHPQQKTRTRTTKKWQKNLFHDHEKKKRKNIDYVHVLEDVPIWWHDILLVIGIFAQQAINKDIISLFFWKISSSSLLVVVLAKSDRWSLREFHYLVAGFDEVCMYNGVECTVACIIVRRLLISVHKWQFSGMADTHEYWSQHDARLVI